MTYGDLSREEQVRLGAQMLAVAAAVVGRTLVTGPRTRTGTARSIVSGTYESKVSKSQETGIYHGRSVQRPVDGGPMDQPGRGKRSSKKVG